jgi:nicotinate phosphoribosyltransferase
MGKATWPGRKQVWRQYGVDGRMVGDTLSVEGDEQPGEPLIRQVMRGGKRTSPAPSLAEIRMHAARELHSLPEPLRNLRPDAPHPIHVGAALMNLTSAFDRRWEELEQEP